MKRTDGIKSFLKAHARSDLARLYNHDMEVQLNVLQKDGERINKEFRGTKYMVYSNGLEEWKSFRIPYKANSEPEYTDVPLTFSLDKYAKAIGMTGWDWVSRCSRWVAFDFDAITGHSERHSRKSTPEELEEIKNLASEIPWVEVRYSTSGQGLHFYVYVDNVPTANHTEHAALARSILFKMSGEVGFNFENKVDICGGNMWVWHRNMDPERGFLCVKKSAELVSTPENWKQQLEVVRRKSAKVKHTNLESALNADQKFESLAAQSNHTALDDGHKALIKWLQGSGYVAWWDADHHMLVTHTHALKLAHTELGLKGIYETLSKGDNPTEQNCFMFPIRNSAWSVRRFTPGVDEAQTWEKDSQSWTKCYYNRNPDFRTACLSKKGIENEKGEFVFTRAEQIKDVGLLLNTEIDIPSHLDGMNGGKMKIHKDGKRIVVMLPDNGQSLPQWLKEGRTFKKICSATLDTSNQEINADDYGEIVRHLISEAGANEGWSLKTDNAWNDEPINHIQFALQSMGYSPKDVKQIIGTLVHKPWKIIRQPFQPEYPGDRRWNRNAPQLKHTPSLEDRSHPTWDLILGHLGKSLDPIVKTTKWCRSNNILTGREYLLLWVSSLIQYPCEPLPYLFIYGNKQCTGKSTFHEALNTLFTSGAVVRADHALKSSDFNGELADAILCVVEETDLSKSTGAYAKIKDWVTSQHISIHKKGKTPFVGINTTHWVQCSNDRKSCPIFPGDTRITMIHIEEPPEKVLPRRELFKRLKAEASNFLGTVLDIDIPPSEDRLMVPMLETPDKIAAAAVNVDALTRFIEEKCYLIDGAKTTVHDFFTAFMESLEPLERPAWTKQKVTSLMPNNVCKAKFNSHLYWGNISLEKVKPGKRLIAINGTFGEVETDALFQE